MKPVLALLLVSILVACGGATSSQPPPAAAPAAAAPAADAAAPATPAAPAAKLKLGPNFTPDGVVFAFQPGGSKARKIILAGSWNGWKPDNPEFQMKDDDGDGIYTITVKLPPGPYQYKYVVDGTWTKDPESPGQTNDGYGGMNGTFTVP